MKHHLEYFLCILFTGLAIITACKKEYSCEGCNENNKPPIAIAGSDQVITLPTDSISLDGSASNDPDGTISVWLWKKISGPATFNISTASAAKTVVRNLDTGVYRFELKVTDDKNLSATDTVQIFVNKQGQLANRPPVANAGADQTITLPTNTITLNGSTSTDPDNNITAYAWTKISGPSSLNIANANAVQTQATNLLQGTYKFELKVTDAGGLFDKDTVQVSVTNQPCSQPPLIQTICDNSTRPQICAQLIPVGTLSEARAAVSVASAGNKILFAGGDGPSYPMGGSSRVDIYNIATQSWSTAELSVGRYEIAATANGNKIFFAGGETGDGTWTTNAVDIYDVTTNTWTVDHLSIPGAYIAAEAVANKVFFAGGDGKANAGMIRTRRVDIFDLTTSSWTTAQLSESKRMGHVAVTANNKIYFSGGIDGGSGNATVISNKIDIYDNATGTWSVSVMSEDKSWHAGITVGNKIYWAGGTTGSTPNGYSCLVEIKDINTSNSTTQYLFKHGQWSGSLGANAVVKNNKIIFLRNFGDDRFDIYDITSNTWSIGVLPVELSYSSIISVNNTIYIAGGWVNGVLSNQVWKLEF